MEVIGKEEKQGLGNAYMSVATGPGFIVLTVASNFRPDVFPLSPATLNKKKDLPKVKASDFVTLSSPAFDAAYKMADGYAAGLAVRITQIHNSVRHSYRFGQLLIPHSRFWPSAAGTERSPELTIEEREGLYGRSD